MEKINQKEVRIGNYVNVIGLLPVIVTWQHIKSISEGDNQYRPILIAEYWLLKFGFEPSGRKEEYCLSKNDCNVIISRIQGDWNFIWELSFMGRPIKYVHQLQNLYFAVTGMELVYSL